MDKNRLYDRLLEELFLIEKKGRIAIIFYIILISLFTLIIIPLFTYTSYSGGLIAMVVGVVIWLLVFLSLIPLFKLFQPIDPKRYTDYTVFAVLLNLLPMLVLTYIMTYLLRLAIFENFNLPVPISRGEYEYVQNHFIIIPIILGFLIYVFLIILVWIVHNKSKLLTRAFSLWYELMEPINRKYQEEYERFYLEYCRFVDEYYRGWYAAYYGELEDR